MALDLPHKENILKCIWVNMIGRLDAQLVKFKLKEERSQMTCHEFEALMQDVIDRETTAETLKLFELRQDNCQGCHKKFEQEQEMVAMIRGKLDREKCPQLLEAMIRSKVLYSQ